MGNISKDNYFDKCFKIIYEEKHGVSENLIKKIGEEEFEQFKFSGFIKTNYCVWEITKTGINMYESIYKEPTLIESLKGYYCHYILGW